MRQNAHAIAAPAPHSGWLGATLRLRVWPALVPFIFPAALLLLWQVTSSAGWLPRQILPPPSMVLEDFKDMTANGELLQHTTRSLLRVIQGFAVGASLGLVLGMAMGLSARFRALVEPVFTAIAQIPAIGLIPLLILLVGIDESLKILVIAKAALVPVTVNTYMGILNVPRAYREVGDVLTFGPALTLRKIVLPAAVPSIFTGIRYGLTNAWLALVAVELLVSSEGLGYLMVWGRQLFQLDFVLVAMIMIGIIGFLLDAILARIELRLQRWKLVTQ